jgi:hypothetical protein
VVTGTAIVRYFVTRDVLDPLVLFSAALVWYFGLHTLWMANTSHALYVQHHIFGTFAPYLAPGLALLGLGYVALVAAFTWYRPQSKRVRPQRLHSRAALIVSFSVGMAMDVAQVAAGGFTKQYQNLGVGAQATGSIQTYHTLGFIALVALVICTVQHYQTGDFRRLMWIMLVVQVAFAFAVAQKALAFEAVFAWLAARNYSGSRLSVKAVTVAIAVGLFVITPVIQSSRGAGQFATTGAQGTLGSAKATGRSVPRRIVGYFQGLPGSALIGWNIINYRTDGTESLALAIGDTPSEYGYLYGRHLPLVLEAPIPHAIWPGKPSYDPSTYFSEKYAKESAATGFGLTFAPTLPGDFYMNFGWLGLIAGMAATGLILGLVTRARERLDGGLGVAIYVAVMLGVILVERDMTDVGTTVLLQLVAVAVTYVLLRVTESLLPANFERQASGRGERCHVPVDVSSAVKVAGPPRRTAL